MSGRDIISQHHNMLFEGEREDDVIWMIDTLAQMHAERHGWNVADVSYQFAGGVMCVLFAGFKLGAYVEGMRQIRGLFQGITVNDYVQRTFRDSIESTLLAATNWKEAITLGNERGVRSLFKDARAMPNTMQDYARMGATARLTEIRSEIASIRAAFPELDGIAQERREPGRPKAEAAPAQEAPAVPGEQGRPKRRKMSAKARKGISEVQKKRWAARKAKQA